MTITHIEELETEEEWMDAFPVMVQLWDDIPRNITEQSFVQLLHELQEIEGYRLFGLFVDESVVAVAGVALRMSAWYGRYLWVYDIVTDADYRSNGFGTEMLSYLKCWANDHNCETIALASALERGGAHQLYEGIGMEKSSYVFTESLD